MNKQQNLLDGFDNWSQEHQKMFLQARTELEKEKALAEIRKQKDDEEYRKQILRQNSTTLQDSKLEKISSDSESEDSIQSEGDQVEQYQTTTQPKEEYIQESNNDHLDQNFKLIQNAQLKRDQIYYLLMKNFCDNVIEGSFVKINEPNLIRRREQNYAIAQVVSIVEGDKAYQLEQTQTYKLLKLQFGEIKEAKLRHITLVSNQPIQKQEFVVWQKRCEENGIIVPTKEFLQRKEKDIKNSSQKLSDDQIKQRININITKWVQNPRSSTLYHDLPIYQNFLKGLINNNKSCIDQGEEQIQEIKDSVEESEKLKPEETARIMRIQQFNKQKNEEIIHINDELKKIDTLLKLFKDNQNLKNEQPISKKQNNDNIQKQNLPTQSYFVNYDYMKQIDQRYIRTYQNLKTIDGSEQFKERFLQMHSKQLDIDNLVDDMMQLE